MKHPASLTAGIFLILIAIAQLLRFLFQVNIIADGIEIPVWMSAVAALFLGALAGWILKERKESVK
jgi:hypothetical protein